MSTLTPRGATYTHRDWKTEMAVAATCVAGICADLQEMSASGEAVKAGETHRRLVDANLITGVEFLKSVVNLVGTTDDRYLPVYDAIRTAGGQHEVAQDKTYHQDY